MEGTMTDYTDPANRKEIDKIVLNTICKYSMDTVYFKDCNSRFIWNSLEHVQQLGMRKPEDVIGKTDFDFFPKDFAQSARDTEITVMASGQAILNVTEELVLDDDNVRYFLASKYPLYDDNGDIIGTWGTSKDVTNQKLLEKELERSYRKMELLARVDDMSGLYNRRHFYEKIDKLVSLYEEREDDSTFSLAVIDVDDMKTINDQYGQQNGDIVLKTIAEILLSNTKKSDTCFRTGGDEFAILLLDSDKMKALGAAKRLVDLIAGTPIILDGKREKVTISVGLATFDKTNPDVSELLSITERKLNKSKREGKNQVSF